MTEYIPNGYATELFGLRRGQQYVADTGEQAVRQAIDPNIMIAIEGKEVKATIIKGRGSESPMVEPIGTIEL